MITTVWDFTKRCATAVRHVNGVLALGTGLSILVTVSAIYSHRAHNEKIVSERFDALTAQAVKQLRRQMEMYEKGTRALRGAVIASGDQLSLARFQQYSASRNIRTEFPGVRGFGFIKIVPADSVK